MHPVRALRHLLLALQFFTRVPLGPRLSAWVGYSPDLLRAALGHFPAVGALLGVPLAAFSAALLELLPGTAATPWVVAALGTALGVLLTGGLHEDGLADVADGLAGSAERERALQIMKDPRLGAFGTLALLLVVLNKMALLALLATLSVRGLAAALVLGHVLSRSWPLVLVAVLPNVGDPTASKSLAITRGGSAGSVRCALLWCAAAVAGTLMWLAYPPFTRAGRVPASAGCAVLLGLLASALVFLALWRWFARRLQGYTGDCLGAVQQLTELAFYLGVALAGGMVP